MGLIQTKKNLVISAGTRVLVARGITWRPRKIIENWTPLWAIATDGEWVAATSDNSVVVWKGGTKYAHFLENAPIFDIFIQNGNLFAVTFSGEVTVRTLSSKRSVWSKKLSEWIESVDLSNEIIAFGTASGAVILLEAFSGNHIGKIEAHSEPVSAVKIYQNYLVTAGESCVKLWDLRNLEGHITPIKTIYLYGKEATALEVSDKTLLIGCSDGNIWVWNLTTQKSQGIMRGHSSPPIRMKSYDHKKLVSAS
ncbi:MAG: hypothetical protein QXL15_03505, partial [Candidatus Korarchaeota archaeon]